MSSTNYNSRYDMTELMDVIDTTIDDLLLANPNERTYYSDPLAQKIVELSYRITNYTTYMISDADSITTIAYRAYGTTTLWWFLLMFNGLDHVMQLVAGMELRIPDKSQIDSIIADLKKDPGIGQVIRI